MNTEAQNLACKLLDALKYDTDAIDLDTVEEKIDEIFFKKDEPAPEPPNFAGTRKALGQLSIPPNERNNHE